ncbi:MAG: acyl carrier protein [Pirellulaceae bacterium]
MTEEPDPFMIVATALKCDRTILTLDSAMHRTYGWDSLAHIDIVMGLERACGVSISNDEILTLSNMASIVAFCDRTTKSLRNEG